MDNQQELIGKEILSNTKGISVYFEGQELDMPTVTRQTAGLLFKSTLKVTRPDDFVASSIGYVL